MILTKDELAYVKSKGQVKVMGTDYIIVRTVSGSSVRLSIEKIRAAAKLVNGAATKPTPPLSAPTHPPTTVFEDLLEKAKKQQARDAVAVQLASQRQHEEELNEAEALEYAEHEQDGLERLLTPIEDHWKSDQLAAPDETPIMEKCKAIMELPVASHELRPIAPLVHVVEPAHAKLAPSSMKMFKSCYASLLPLEHPTLERYSPYAAEGTAAHELFATAATVLLRDGPSMALGIVEFAQAKEGEHPYTDEMRMHCRELILLCDRILTKIGKDCILSTLIESRVKFSEHIYGTIDFGILYVKDNKKKIYALDLKYGKGTPVRAEGNEQLLTYVLAMIETHSWDAAEAIIAVYQPRNTDEHLDPLDLWQIDAAVIKKARRELRRFETIALKVMSGDRKAKECVGDWCKFCKRKDAMECKSYAKAARIPGMIELDKATPLIKTPVMHALSEDQLDFICRNSERVRTFLKEVETYVATRCLSANPLKGWKLVGGKTVRKWLENEVAVAAELEKLGVVNPWKQVLKGIGEVEKVLGKAAAKTALAPLTRRSSPKPKLVTEDDPRPAITNDSADLLTCLDEEEAEAS